MVKLSDSSCQLATVTGIVADRPCFMSAIVTIMTPGDQKSLSVESIYLRIQTRRRFEIGNSDVVFRYF